MRLTLRITNVSDYAAPMRVFIMYFIVTLFDTKFIVYGHTIFPNLPYVKKYFWKII